MSLRQYFAFALFALVLANGLHAQTILTWDVELDPPPVPQDGSGTWNLTNNNWVQSNPGPTFAQANFINVVSDVFFGTAATGNAAGTVNVADAGIIVNSMTINPTASGTYIFTGTNFQVTNALTVGGNGVQFGNGGTTGSFTAGSVVLNSSITFNRSDTFTISSAMSGGAAVGLVKNGAGTLVLTANNSYTGTTNINAGAVQLGNNGATGSISSSAVNFTNNSSLIFNRSNDLTFSGNLGNGVNTAGNIVKNGAGNLTLTGTNTYTGSTTVNSGTLTLGSANALGTGNLTLNSGTTLNLGGFSDSVGVVNLNGGSITGGGTLTATSVNLLSGTGVVNSNLSTGGSFAVSGGSTLSGSGTITGDVNMAANSRLSPGNSPGTLNVTGSLSLGGFYDWEYNALTADLVNVSNSLTLTGATLNLLELGVPSLNTKYTLFSYSSLVGTFTGLADDSTFTSGGRSWLINYNDTLAGINGGTQSNFVTLTLTAVPEPSSIALIGLGVFGLVIRRKR